MVEAVVADSSVWIDLLRERRTQEASVLRTFVSTPDAPLLLVPDLVLYEVLRGARSDAAWNQADEQMRRLPIVGLGGEATVRAAAARYRHLRSVGITVRKSIDVLIASWCIDNDVALLHRDRDFAPFEDVFGLRTV